MNIEQLLILCLSLVLLNLLHQQHRSQLKWLWQRTKDRLPRKWKAKSPRDCPGCQAGVSLADSTTVT